MWLGATHPPITRRKAILYWRRQRFVINWLPLC